MAAIPPLIALDKVPTEADGCGQGVNCPTRRYNYGVTGLATSGRIAVESPQPASLCLDHAAALAPRRTFVGGASASGRPFVILDGLF